MGECQLRKLPAINGFAKGCELVQRFNTWAGSGRKRRKSAEFRAETDDAWQGRKRFFHNLVNHIRLAACLRAKVARQRAAGAVAIRSSGAVESQNR